MEKCRYKSLEELPAIMCADDVKDVLGISISSTYELMKEKDFPSRQQHLLFWFVKVNQGFITPRQAGGGIDDLPLLWMRK